MLRKTCLLTDGMVQLSGNSFGQQMPETPRCRAHGMTAIGHYALAERKANPECLSVVVVVVIMMG